jgi:hypothetical protein
LRTLQLGHLHSQLDPLHTHGLLLHEAERMCVTLLGSIS